ncbi:class B sortase [uncultured Robinsoniella sp.]|uniref:class B sortase n=1 Tax=uncultured Robinsoniella sp. TaxID=904190 RepID=UPI00374EB24B
MKKKDQKINVRWLIIGVVAFLLAGLCICFVINHETQKKAAVKLYDSLETRDDRKRKDYQPEVSTEGNSETKSSKKIEKQSETDSFSIETDMPVNITEIQKNMPDVYAWIEIPGTKINYPIVQRKDDNSYYLDKTPDGSLNIEGSIFSENYNSKDFTDPVTILYGHNMKNGDMFGELHKYEDKSFFEDNKEIYIYTKYKKLTYHIFATVLFDNRHLIESYDFSKEDIFLQYIRDIVDVNDMRSHVDKNISIVKTDKILTLSTCHGMGSSYRYLLLAVLSE